MDTRLFEAARRGDIGALNALIDNDQDILERNLLHVATSAMKVDFVKEVVSIRPELAKRLNRDGFSPIHLASANGFVEIVRELLSSNKELVRLYSKDGRTALHCAIITGRVDVVKEVVTACPESISDLTGRGDSALHLAVKNSQLEAFRLLLKILMQRNMETDKELINAKDEDGNTILHLATSRKLYKTMKLLLGDSDGIPIGKVDVNVTNKNGVTALDMLDALQQIVIEPGDIHLRQLLQTANARRSQDLSLGRHSTNVPRTPVDDNNPESADTMFSLLRELKKLWHDLNPYRFWKELTKEAGDILPEKQNALLVVAVLIADLTYNSVLNPPGGFKQPINNDDGQNSHNNGMANMSSDLVIFILVAFLNSVGFVSALAMIFLLTSKFPFKKLFRLLLITMASTYVCGLLYISPFDYVTAYTWCILTGLAFLIIHALVFIRWLGKKWWRNNG